MIAPAPAPGTAPNYAAQTDAWIAAHPEAFGLFCRFALEKAGRGQRFGAKALAERVRWEHAEALEHAPDDLALNNNFVAHIMRRVCERHPMVRPFVQMRGAGSMSAAGEAREPACMRDGADSSAVLNGKPGRATTASRRVDQSPRQLQAEPSPSAARSSPGTLFELPPQTSRWRS